MSYVVYEVETTRLVGNAYATEAAAKAARTRLTKKLAQEGKTAPEMAVAEREYFTEEVEMWVERTNMMSGKKYLERYNTPVYMSPSCESYWSM